MIIAMLLVLGIAAVSLLYNFTMEPAPDEATRVNYAASLQNDFAEKNVKDMTVSASGPDKGFLRLRADWLDHPTAIALISEDIGSRARMYGFQRVIFENEGTSFTYDLGKQNFVSE